jgi:hypothetical protein
VLDGSDGKDGNNGADGKDGNGIKSAVLNADYTLTLTFDDGTTYTTPSIRGATGAAGTNGTDGVDGISPTVAVSKSGNVTTMTVTDKNGTKTATIADGTDGADGKDGLDATPVTPLFANSVDECTDTSKFYVLPDGFIYAYQYVEKRNVRICQLGFVMV